MGMVKKRKDEEILMDGRVWSLHLEGNETPR